MLSLPHARSRTSQFMGPNQGFHIAQGHGFPSLEDRGHPRGAVAVVAAYEPVVVGVVEQGQVRIR
jgi:hypothetical protein